MNKTAKLNKNQGPKSVDYTVLTAAINNAALSRRAALQIELSVGLIHFTQEIDGTSTIGKANLKALYHAAGYECLAKSDRDYKTVNRRLNAVSKLFDKLGSSIVHAWFESCAGDTAQTLEYVVTELQSYGFDTLDDVADYCGVESNRTRQPRQTSGPVTSTKSSDETDDTPAKLDLDVLRGQLLEQYGDEMLREFASQLMVDIAARAPAEEKKVA